MRPGPGARAILAGFGPAPLRAQDATGDVLAGVRHLLMDIDRGSALAAARRSAWSVNVLGALLALLAFGALW